MKIVSVVVFIIIAGLGMCQISSASEEEALQKIGFVKNDGANVRAGDNINFEGLCKLDKGDPVKIIGKRYSWFKIILPQKARLYIKNDYVDMTSEKMIGEVNASRVNLRAGPDTKYSILGQVSKPEKLIVVSEEGGWYKIKPPTATTGWIHSTQIRFSLSEIVFTEIEKEKPKVTKKRIKPAVKVDTEKSDTVRLMIKQQEPQGNLVFSTQGK